MTKDIMNIIQAYNKSLNVAEQIWDYLYDMLQEKYGEDEGSRILHDELQIFDLKSMEFHLLDEKRAMEILKGD